MMFSATRVHAFNAPSTMPDAADSIEVGGPPRPKGSGITPPFCRTAPPTILALTSAVNVAGGAFVSRMKGIIQC